MINLEGIRACYDIKNNNFDNNINEYKENNSSFQISNNCEEILNIFGDFSKEKKYF